MAVLRFEIAYDGTHYSGWQIQPNVPTVQGEVHKALAKIYNVPIKVGGASRTDSGVHANGQVVSFREPEGRRAVPPRELHRALNAMMPDDISVLRADRVEALDERGWPFHARHCARGKIYRYHLWLNPVCDPFLRHRALLVRGRINEDGWRRIRGAAQQLLGQHDFAGFRQASCDSRATVRRLDRVEIITPPPGKYRAEIVIQGTAFLKNMVRIIVGTLIDIGQGRIPPDRIEEVLASKDRTRAGKTAPPHGLCLEEVFYPDFPWQHARWTLPSA